LAAAFVATMQFEAGAEVILELAPFLDVEIIHERDQAGLFEAIVTEELAHVRPVLLLDVGVVVLAVGAAASEGHAAPLPAHQILVEWPVQELTAIVGVEAFQSEGSFGFNVFKVIKDGLTTLVPDGAQFGPAA